MTIARQRARNLLRSGTPVVVFDGAAQVPPLPHPPQGILRHLRRRVQDLASSRHRSSLSWKRDRLSPAAKRSLKFGGVLERASRCGKSASACLTIFARAHEGSVMTSRSARLLLLACSVTAVIADACS